MFIIVSQVYWESDPDPITVVECNNNNKDSIAGFKTPEAAHEFMRRKFSAVRCDCPMWAAGCGEWGSSPNYYHIKQVQLVEPAAEPADLDPYDGVTPADHGSDCP